MLGLASLAVFILAVSLVGGAFYYSSNAAVLSKDQEILGLRATVLSQNATILQLEIDILRLNANLTNLNAEVTALSINQTANKINLAVLTSQVSTLQNESALLSLELAVAERVGGLAVLTYVADRTTSVQPGGAVEVTNQANGYNGTLAFLSTNGCPSSGEDVNMIGSQYTLGIILNSTGPPLMSDFSNLSGEPFSVYMQNVGSTPVQCTFSLLYVRH